MYNTINSLVSQAIEPTDNFSPQSRHGFSDAQIADFVQANIGNPQVIANAAQQYGISPAEISKATGYSLDQISSYFSAANAQPPVVNTVDKLTQQILASSDPSKWTGQGFGSAQANAADMAKILSGIGITDLSQFGQVSQTLPDQQQWEGDETGGYVTVPGATIKTFGNKLTGQAVPNTYSERQSGNAFGGTFAGSGNTGYRVNFDANGNPQIYTTGASSSNLKDFAPLLAIGGLALGAPYLSELFGSGAAALGAEAGTAAGAGASTIAGTGMTLGELAQLDMALGGAGGTAGALEMASTIGGTGAAAAAADAISGMGGGTGIQTGNTALSSMGGGTGLLPSTAANLEAMGGAQGLTSAAAGGGTLGAAGLNSGLGVGAGLGQTLAGVDTGLTSSLANGSLGSNLATFTGGALGAESAASTTIANTGMTLGELAQLDLALGGAGGTAGALEMAGTIGGAAGVASAAAVVDALGGGTGLTASASGLGLTTGGGTGLTAGTSGLGGGLGTSLSNLTTGLGADLGTGLAAGATGLGLGAGGGTGLATGGTGLGSGLGGTLGAVDTGLATGLTGAGLGSELAAGGTGLTAGGTGLGGGLATDATLGAGLGAAGASGLGAGSSLGTGLTSGGLGLTAGTAGLGAEGLGAGLAAGAGGLAAGNSLLGGSALGSTLGSTMTGALGATTGSALGAAAGSTLGSGLGSALGTTLGQGIGLNALGNVGATIANQQGIAQARDLINKYGTQAQTNLADAYRNAQGLNAANRTDLGNLYANTSGNLQNLYNQQVGYQAPYQQVGQSATQGLIANQPYFTHQFDVNDLNTNLAPNYAFMLGQGQMANQRAANAGGGALGGNALQGLQRYTQDYAGNAYQQAFNNYNTQRNNIYNSLAGMAGIGQTSTGQLANLGNAYGSNMAGLSSNYGGNLVSNAGQGIGAANAYGLNTANLATGIGSALASNATQQGANNASLLSNLGNTALLGSMIKAT